MSFTQYHARPQANSLSTLDFASLHNLGVGVQKQGQSAKQQEQEVAQQFEALIIQQLLKQARSSSMGTLFDNDQSKMVKSMFDDQIAVELSNPGIGLAQAIMQQIHDFRGDKLEAKQLSLSELQSLYKSRVPHLGSVFGLDTTKSSASGKDLPIANSISELIDVLTKPVRSIEKISGAVRGAPTHIRDFVSSMTPSAYKAAAESGVPASLILSQAALESGWGKRIITDENGKNSFNLFGIKATTNWKGKVVNVMTTEYVDGTARKMVQPFRAYGSYDESFKDYAKLISNNSRYQGVIEAGDATKAAHAIQKAGYATDPKYAEKLISIMGYFNSSSSNLTAQAGNLNQAVSNRISDFGRNAIPNSGF